MNPIITENFADNGEHSHWSVIDKSTGKIIVEDILRCANLACDDDCAYSIGDKECLGCKIYHRRRKFYFDN
jgi:hypothetical protein